MSTTRADKLAARLADAGIDILLVTHLTNVRYLTGYTGSNGLALIGPELREFVTDFRYVEQAAAEVDAAFTRRRAPQDLLEAIDELLPAGTVKLGFEAAHMSVATHGGLRGLLDERIELVSGTDLVEGLRAIKEP